MIFLKVDIQNLTRMSNLWFEMGILNKISRRGADHESSRIYSTLFSENIREMNKESAGNWCSTISFTFQNHDALPPWDSVTISYECVTSAPERPIMIEAAQYVSWDS